MEQVIATSWVKVFKHDELYVFVSREDTKNDEAPYALQVRFEVEDGIEVKVAPEYADEDKRDANFDTFDAERALNTVNGIKEQFFKQKGEPI